MKLQNSGLLIGQVFGLLIGSVAAYLIWGWNAPGGILILFGFAIGGLIGWFLGKKREEKTNPEDVR
ncbi:MAG: hypothetical protein JW976_00265 [Syntrophaceae bacterium]|nr:hypothetical protein [Syntrophaceae bacterium]